MTRPSRRVYPRPTVLEVLIFVALFAACGATVWIVSILKP